MSRPILKLFVTASFAEGECYTDVGRHSRLLVLNETLETTFCEDSEVSGELIFKSKASFRSEVEVRFPLLDIAEISADSYERIDAETLCERKYIMCIH